MHSLVSRDFDGENATAVRSYLPLGHPDLDGNANATADLQRTRVYELLWPMLDNFLKEEISNGGHLVRVSFDVEAGGSFADFSLWLGRLAIWSDLSLALLSLAFVYLFIIFHTKSLLLGTLGALEIFCSFPLSLFVYQHVFGVELLGVMHIIGIYVILGIGCDDIFVSLTRISKRGWRRRNASRR